MTGVVAPDGLPCAAWRTFFKRSCASLGQDEEFCASASSPLERAIASAAFCRHTGEFELGGEVPRPGGERLEQLLRLRVVRRLLHALELLRQRVGALRSAGSSPSPGANGAPTPAGCPFGFPRARAIARWTRCAAPAPTPWPAEWRPRPFAAVAREATRDSPSRLLHRERVAEDDPTPCARAGPGSSASAASDT